MRRSLWLIALAVLLLAAGVAVDWRLGGPPFRREEESASAPTIVLILTDDQRWDSLSAMPNVRTLLARHGVTFTNSFVADPLCCPSRAAILTGQYPHTTGVWENGSGPFAGFHAFRDGVTLATRLHAAGYHAALFGKYLNGYERTTYVPPGWDRWEAFDGPAAGAAYYYGYRLNVDGHLQTFGSSRGDYSTNVLAGRASSFIRSTKGPLFVYFAPFAPHAPSIPAPGDAARFSRLSPFRPAGYDQASVATEPAWVRALPRLSPEVRAATDRLRRDGLASLRAVDRAVSRIVDALVATGRLGDTLIAFTSDNGFNFGEHRWVGKAVPWEESIRVPLVIRFDRMATGPRSDARLVVNVDLAPTFAQLAGTSMPGAEGRSLVPLLQGRAVAWRRDVGIEGLHGGGGRVPPYCAVRTGRFLFAAYVTGDLQLYDLKADPHELHSRATDPAFADRVAMFEARLKQVCNPPPPGSPKGFPP